MAFIVIGALGFIWMGFWVFMYSKPSESKHVNKAELEYIEQDKHEEGAAPVVEEKDEKKMKFWQCFSYKQTWAFAFGKFMTDGVWWFFLFWTPYPMLPFISRRIRLFISTAYSSGSSFETSSANPLTMHALASSSVMPRDIR